MLERIYTSLGIVAMVAILVVAGVYLTDNRPDFVPGGVTVGNEYTATTTPDGVQEWTDQNIAIGWGALGSVIITKAGTVDYTLFDATSTGAVLNDSRFNRSTQQLARISSGLAVGTYQFDVIYTDGLVMDVTQSGTGTSTITHRP